MRKFWKVKKSKTLLKNEDGATMFEFALVAPFLIIMMLGVIEISMVMLAQNVMESATFAASRQGKTGYVSNGITREQTIINTLNQRASGLLNVSQITIRTTTYNNFDQIGQPEPFVDANDNGERDEGENFTDLNANGVYDEDVGASGAGAAGQVVVYDVTYPWQMMTPIIPSVMGLPGGVITLTSRAVIKNEPFGS